MPLKVRVVIDHIITGDEESLTPTMVRSAISKFYNSIGPQNAEVKMNGIKIECDDIPLSHHLKASPENATGHLRSLEVVRPHAEPLFLRLQDSQGEMSNLPVLWTYTVQEVKDTIEHHHGISGETLKLTIDGRQLDNKGTLSDLMVRTLRGKDLIIQGRTTDTVNDLMLKLEELEGVPVAEQRILFAGYQLCDSDSDTLGDYGIGAGSVVRLVGRLRGCDCGCGKDKYYLHVDLTHTGHDEAGPNNDGCHVGSVRMNDDGTTRDQHQTFAG